MKRVLILTLMCAFAGVVSAQTKMVRLTRFEGINISGLNVSRGITAEIYQSDKTYATIEMPAEYEKYIIFEIDGAGTVKIGFNDDLNNLLKGLGKRENFRSDLIKAKVYVRNLSRIHASTSAKIICFGMFNGDNVDVKLSTSARVSDLNITVKNVMNLESSTSAKFAGNITTDAFRGKLNTSTRADMEVQAQSVDVSLSTSSRMVMRGFTGSLKVNANTSSTFTGEGINSATADLTSSTSGKITVGETKELVARAGSGGSIRYKGSPKHTDVRSSSGGSISPLN